MENEQPKTVERKKEKKNYIGFVSVGILIIAILIGATFAWFSMGRRVSTVSEIHTPTVLMIGSGNKEDVEQLYLGDIDITSGTPVEGQENVLSRDFVFCVYSDIYDKFVLQLAHTTNIAFDYTIYMADDVTGELSEAEKTDVIADGTQKNVAYLGLDDNTYYYQKHGTKLNGEYKNKGEGRLAARDDNAYSLTYDTYQNVQKNAVPLYWLSETIDPPAAPDGSFVQYFVLTLTWNIEEVKNDKETDLVYILASLVTDTGSDGN